jgi:2'-5' RNA ligase
MDGVVSLLDDEHYRRVEGIWAEFRDRFGMPRLYRTPIPHFSYHIAEQYGREPLEVALGRIAAELPRFKVMTTGLGIFTGGQPVLYIPVVRSRTLDDLQKLLWAEVSRFASGASAHYAPARWMPHITLADGNFDPALLPELVRLLSARDFTWEISVDNLCVISSTGSVYVRCDLVAPASLRLARWSKTRHNTGYDRRRNRTDN